LSERVGREPGLCAEMAAEQGIRGAFGSALPADEPAHRPERIVGHRNGRREAGGGRREGIIRMTFRLPFYRLPPTVFDHART